MAGLFDDLDPDTEATTDYRYTPPATGGMKAPAGLFDDLDPDDLYGPPTNPNNVPRNYTELEALQTMPGNYIPSAQKYLEAFGHAVTNPGESLPVLWNMVQGLAAMNPGNIAGVPGRAAGVPKDDMQNLEVIGKDNHEAFGTWENFKRTFAEDPVRLLTSLMAFVPGGSVFGPMAAGGGRVARGAAMVGDAFLNPLMAAEPIAQGTGHLVRASMNRATISPKARALHDSLEGIGGQQEQALAALERGNHSYVKGSNPDAMTAIVHDLIAPDAHSLQNEANALVSAVSEQRKINNAKAQVNALREHGGTPNQLKLAKQARKDAAKTEYGDAGVFFDPKEAGQYPIESRTYRIDNNLKKLIDERPSIGEVYAAAQKGSADSGVPFQVGENRDGYLIKGQPSANRVVSDEVFNDLQSNQPLHTNVDQNAGRYLQVPEQRARLYADALHRMKVLLSEKAANARENGNGTIATDTANASRALVAWLRENNPEYAKAMDNYKARSKRINEMEILQELERTLQNPTLGDETTKHLADAYSRAILRAPGMKSLLSRTTGESYIKDLESGLSPAAYKTIQDIQLDLSRDKLAAERAKSGKKGVINNLVEVPQAPGWMNAHTTIGNALSRWVFGGMGAKEAKELANAMQTPEGAAVILRQAVEQHNALNNQSIPFHFVGGKVKAINRHGGPVVNYLREQEESKRK